MTKIPNINIIELFLQVILLEVEEFHGLHDDLKIILKMLTTILNRSSDSLKNGVIIVGVNQKIFFYLS